MSRIIAALILSLLIPLATADFEEEFKSYVKKTATRPILRSLKKLDLSSRSDPVRILAPESSVTVDSASISKNLRGEPELLKKDKVVNFIYHVVYESDDCAGDISDDREALKIGFCYHDGDDVSEDEGRYFKIIGGKDSPNKITIARFRDEGCTISTKNYDPVPGECYSGQEFGYVYGSNPIKKSDGLYWSKFSSAAACDKIDFDDAIHFEYLPYSYPDGAFNKPFMISCDTPTRADFTLYKMGKNGKFTVKKTESMESECFEDDGGFVRVICASGY